MAPGTIAAGRGQRLIARLFAPVDGASLAYFRIAFGGIMLWEVVRYLGLGWVSSYYIEPEFYFPYFGFEWIRPWPGEGMYLHFLGLGLLALLLAQGFLYRFASVLFFLAFTYVFLLDQSNYLNHFYLVCTVSFLLIFVPAHRVCSFDRLLARRQWPATVPTWSLWLLRFQIGVAYFFGGIAKLNGDWLQGEPMRLWLGDRADLGLIGPLLDEPWAPYFFSYSGIAIDLFVPILLCFRRTRIWAFAIGVLFNLTNVALFSIGIFPWFMIAVMGLFFEPDWPRRVCERLRRGGAQDAIQGTPAAVAAEGHRWGTLRAGQRAILVLLALFVAFEVVTPFRHLLYPGNVNWTEEGHNWSWHMKLRDKSAKAKFRVVDMDTQKEWKIDPKKHLTSRQRRKMSHRPDMILQYAHYLASKYRSEKRPNIAVYADVTASLNGRKYQRLIDPDVNLAAVKASLWPAPWIVPLTEPLVLTPADEGGEEDGADADIE